MDDVAGGGVGVVELVGQRVVVIVSARPIYAALGVVVVDGVVVVAVPGLDDIADGAIVRDGLADEQAPRVVAVGLDYTVRTVECPDRVIARGIPAFGGIAGG